MTDAVAQARWDVVLAVTACEQSVGETGTIEEYSRDRETLEASLDAYAAAVRAECADRVRGEVEKMREEMRTGLSEFDGQSMCCDDCTHKALNHLTAKLAALDAP